MIDTFFNGLRRMMVGVIVLVFAFTVTYIPQPHTNVAEAQFAVTEVGPNVYTNIFTTGLTTTIELVGSVLDGLAWAVAKQMISMMLDSLVDWINNGFEGSPAFVQDLRRFLLQAADIAVGEYIEELGGPLSFLCEPFQLDVRLALAVSYDQTRNREVPSCSLTEIFNNVEASNAFFGGDFQSGGWDAWTAITVNPNQTPYGAVLEAESEARARVVNAQGETVTELNFGDGFLSGKLCETATGPDGTQEECFITKPGRVISDQLNKALGAGQDQLVAADEINEVISALVGQIAQRAITGAAGLLGLTGGANYTPYSRGSFAAEVQGGGTGAVGVVSPTEGTGAPIVPGTGLPLDGASGQLTSRIQSSLAASQNFLSQIDAYTTSFNAIINDPSSTEFAISQAQGSLFEAGSLRAQINQSAPAAATIVNRYLELEAAYTTATPDEQIAIRNEQGTLIQQFSALGLPSETQINSTLARWEAILTITIPTAPVGPNAQLCEQAPDLALCRANP